MINLVQATRIFNTNYVKIVQNIFFSPNKYSTCLFSFNSVYNCTYFNRLELHEKMGYSSRNVSDSAYYVKKVLVLYVGGTIGMEKNSQNAYVPSPNRLYQYLRSNSSFHSEELAKKHNLNLKSNQLVQPQLRKCIVLYEIKEYESLLDSSNMSAKDWITIAKDIELHYNNFDGFVILHGTDTLAYTSSALSFMLDSLQKPVILTGSQIPIYESFSDAQDNILSSLTLAGCYNIPEVCIFFAKKLMRGNRTRKISSTHLDAFDSPNFHHLAEIGRDISVHQKYFFNQRKSEFKVFTGLNSKVGLIYLFPTLTSSMLKCMLQQELDGLVLETYGLGNIPSKHTELVEILKETVRRGSLVVNITQCSQGTVSSAYETGKSLEEIGIISGNDMTPEAALTKLCFVLGLPNLTYSERVQLMKENLRGELSSTNNN